MSLDKDLKLAIEDQQLAEIAYNLAWKNREIARKIRKEIAKTSEYNISICYAWIQEIIDIKNGEKGGPIELLIRCIRDFVHKSMHAQRMPYLQFNDQLGVIINNAETEEQKRVLEKYVKMPSVV